MKSRQFLSWWKTTSIRKITRNLSRKIVAAWLMVMLLWPNVMVLLAEPTFAATSPWTQTDWSGGSGQTGWSDITKFDASSNVVTATSGQTTLTNSEKLSNTGFESDSTGWTPTPESAGGTFSDSTFANTSGAVAAWPLDDTTSTQSYVRAVNPAVATGRNMGINGTFDADTNWTKGSNWAISGGQAVATAAPSGGTGNLSQATPMVVGKSYQITYTISGYSSGTVRVLAGNGGVGASRSANGTYTETIICASESTLTFQVTSTFTGSIDNVTVTQLNIPAYNASSTPVLTDGNMETANTSSWTVGGSANLSKSTTNPHGGSRSLQIARTSVNNPFAYQPSTLTLGQVYRITGYARSDGNAVPRVAKFSAASLWDGSTSTSWQQFDFLYVADGTSILLTATTSTGSQYVEFDDVVVSLDNYVRSGEVLTDGNMETSGTGDWTNAAPATLTKDTTAPHSGSQNLRIARNAVNNPLITQPVFAVGKTYRVTGWWKSDGNAIPLIFISTTNGSRGGSTSTSWQFFDFTEVATNAFFGMRASTSTGSQYVEFDDISITEVNPLSGLPINGVTIGSTANGHLTNAYTFDGSNDFVNVYSSDLNSAFNGNEGTAIIWAKVANSGVWTDGTTDNLLVLAGATNYIQISKSATSNTMFFGQSGGSAKSINVGSLSSTGWMQIALSWTKSGDQVKAYINGTQAGATQTGLGTWTDNLVNTSAIIGANNTSGSNPWNGSVNDVRLYNRALTSTEIANLYNGFTAARDTGQAHSGTASIKVITDNYNYADIVQSLNVGDTNTYNLVSYAYTNGSAVTSADAELYYNGATVSTTYTSVGSGWYKLSGTVTGANAARNYGVQVKANKTVYLDDFSVNSYATSGTLTSSIFDTGQGSNWGILTYNALTPTGTSVTVKARSSNNSDMSSATAFSSCAAITSNTDISSNNCITDSHRYVQYQLTLAASDTSLTPTFQDISLAFAVSDAAAPAFSLTPISPDPTTNTRPTLAGSATDATGTISSVEFQMDSTSGSWTACTATDGGFNSATESFSCMPATLTDGGHTIYVRATDNAANVSTPSSDSFTVDTTPPLSLSLASPSNNSYTNNERESFSWHPTTDATSGISKYVLEIDNPSLGDTQPSGDFSVDGIPPTSATDIITKRYVIHYENNLISVRTTSSTDWEIGQNDGKLREGVVRWRVKAVDGAGNEAIAAQTLFVDRTSPETTLTQLNDQPLSQRAYATTDQTPTIFGTVTDRLAGGNQSETQQDVGPRVASGPKQVEVTVTKVDEVLPKTISVTTQQLSAPSWSCSGSPITDNSLQTCDKTSGFSFTPSSSLAFGKYNIKVVGKDGADNSSEKSFQLTVASNIEESGSDQIIENTPTPTATPSPLSSASPTQVQASPKPIVTKAIEPTGPSLLERVGQAGTQMLNSLASTISGVGSGLQRAGSFALTQTSSLFAWLTDTATQGFLAGITSITNGVNLIVDLTRQTIELSGTAIAQTLSSSGQSLLSFSQTTSGFMQGSLRTIGSALFSGGTSLAQSSQSTANWLSMTSRAGTSSVEQALTNSTNYTKHQLFSFGAFLSLNIENASNLLSDTIVAFGYRFSTEPTRIFNVQVTALSPTSAKITWETNHLANGKVNYGLTDAYAQDIQSDEQTKLHEFTLKNLKPNTEYHFEVMSHGKNYVYDANRRFTTPRGE